MPPPDYLRLSQTASNTLADYLPLVYGFLTLILIPVLKRMGYFKAFLNIMRVLMEARAKSEHDAAPQTANGNGNGNGNALRFSAIASESQAKRLDHVEEYQRVNIKRIDAIEAWQRDIIPKLESAAKVGAYNAFSGKMNELSQRVESIENHQASIHVDLEQLTTINTHLAAIRAELNTLKGNLTP